MDKYVNVEFSLIIPKWIWRWDVFGNDMLVVNMTEEVSWWRRWKTKFFLGSKWKRLDDKSI